jgi:NAD(P)-dependent dehydrogenase (short-subunit alcohol dehydrogenase family)
VTKGAPNVESLFSLSGKRVILTGATGLFGRAFAEGLVDAGATVLAFGRNEKALGDLKTKLEARHGQGRLVPYVADCADDAGFRGTLQRAIDAHGGVDVLVNNAFEFSRDTGFNDPSGTMDRISKDQWMRALESGVYWQASAIQVVTPAMKRQGGGSIINISSMYALVSPDPALYRGKTVFNPPTYSVAKAGLVALTRYVASFYGEFGIRCNALLPGSFPNTDPGAFNAPSDDSFLASLAAKTALGRVGKVEDLQGALIFLASNASAYMTGQTLVVDGGWTIR